MSVGVNPVDLIVRSGAYKPEKFPKVRQWASVADEGCDSLALVLHSPQAAHHMLLTTRQSSFPKWSIDCNKTTERVRGAAGRPRLRALGSHCVLVAACGDPSGINRLHADPGRRRGGHCGGG